MKRGKYVKQKKRAPLWYYAALLVLTVIVAFCAWYLADYFLGSRQQAEAYDDLLAQVEAIRGTAPTELRKEDADAAGNPLPNDGDFEMLPPGKIEDIHDENGILLEYAPLYAQNPDLAGWLAIDGTKINYPVMQTPDRVDYYLQRSFSGEYSPWGCIYAREECDLAGPSDNITLYGHNMKDGSMFAGLNAYTSRDFWRSHRYIRFDTLTEHHTYEIFAVFTTTATVGEGFDYHDFIDAADEMEFDTFVAKCLSLSLYGTDLVPKCGDKILCLSTCEYTQTNGRLVVAAVRID
jgi:sortase B